MATIVFDLKAVTGAFVTDFQRAAKEAQKSLGEIKDAARETGAGILESFTGLSTSQLTVAALSAGFGELIKKSIELGDQVNKMSQKIGVSVETLSALRAQAQLSDVSFDDLGSAMGKFAKTQAAAAGGAKQQSEAFAAMGVALKDAEGHLRSQNDVLGDVAKKFASYKDSTEKTALAQVLFGKSGKELIPLLNELGEKGFEEVTKQAKAYNLVIGADQARASQEFHENITRLSQATTGFGLAVTKQLLPSLVNLSSQMAEAAKTSDGYADSASGAVSVIKSFVLGLIAAKETIAGLVNVIAAVFDAVKTTFDASGQFIAAWSQMVAKNIQAAFRFDYSAISANKDAFIKQAGEIAGTFTHNMDVARGAMSSGVTDSVGNVKKAYDALFGTFSNVISGVKTVSKAHEEGVAPLLKNADAAKEATKAAEKLAEMFNKDGETLASIQSKLNPVQKIYSEYVKGIAEANTAYQKEIELAKKAGLGDAALGQAKENLIAKNKALLDVEKAQQAEFIKQNDVVGKYLEKIADDQALIGLTDRQKEITKAVQDLTREWEKDTPAVKAWLAQMGVIDPTSEAGKLKIQEVTGALYDNKQAFDLSQQAAREWQGIWSQSFDKILNTSGNIWTKLKSGFKDLVNSIIQYFEKLAIVNPILNAMFGGSVGFSILPTLANAAGGTALNQTGAAIAQSYIDPSSGNVIGGAAGGAGGIGGLTSPSTWVGLGKNLFSGFSSLWSGTSGGIASFGSIPGGGSYALTAPGAASPFGYGGYGSGFGQALGVAGGIYAGYNEYKNAGGGLAGAAGGLAYGAGTYFAGAGIATAAATGSIAAGLSAIPVVGWIAIAAMLIDKFSGGKLFGTAFKPTGNVAENVSIGANGASVTNSIEEKKNQALFAGHKWRWEDLAATPEQMQFADSVTKAMNQVAQSAATALGHDVGDLVSGAFKQVTDKSGKVTSQISTVLGKQYTEAIDDFVKRMQAENVIAQIGGEADKVADAYRATAQGLSDAAQFLLAAAVDIKHGQSLLGDDKSLISINALVNQLAQSGESLVQTYQRLQTETKALHDSLDMMGVTLSHTGAEFVKFADAAATAAGGVQNLQALLASYGKNYFSADEQGQQQIAYFKKLAGDALTGIGEAADTSMAQFREDFTKVMPTLTPEQLVSWLKAADYLAQATAAQNQYNAALAQANAAQLNGVQNYANIVTSIQDGINQLQHPASDFQKGLMAIGQALVSTEAQLNAAARAAGLAAAREEDLALARKYAELQSQVLAKQLMADSAPLVSSLFGNGSVDQAATSASSSLYNVASGLQAVADAATTFRNSMLLNSQLSPLNVQQQYQEALKQLSADGSSQTAQTALTLARQLMASGDDYAKAFDLITSMVRNNGSTATAGGGGHGSSSSATSAGQTESQRLADAQKLAQNVADLAGFGGKSFADIAKQLGFGLDQLGSILGLQGDDLTKYLTSLEAKSYNLTDMAAMLDKTFTQPIVDALYKALGLYKNINTHIGIPGTIGSIAANDSDGANFSGTPILSRRPILPTPVNPGGVSPPSPEPVTPGDIDRLGDRIINGLTNVAKVTASGAVAVEDATNSVGNKIVNLARAPNVPVSDRVMRSLVA